MVRLTVTTSPNPNPTIISHTQQFVCVEFAPDINVDTDATYDGSKWPTGVDLANRAPTYRMTPAEGQRVGLGYYRGGWPRILKTNQITDTSPQWVRWTTSPPSPVLPPLNTPQNTITSTNPPVTPPATTWTVWDNYSMDFGMATVYQVNHAGTQLYQPALPDTQSTTVNPNPPTADSTAVSSVAPQWLDYRSPALEPEPATPAPPASRLPSFEFNFYQAPGQPTAPYAGQTTKRVTVRYQWTLNQGL